MGKFKHSVFSAFFAPVNAPSSYPKSSLSSNCSDMAAQLITTNGSFLAAAVQVDAVSHDFLTCAAFAGNENSRVCQGILACQFDKVLHSWAVSDDVAKIKRGTRPLE